MSGTETTTRQPPHQPPTRTHDIFLTGATGVIGRRLLPLLVGAGHRVIAVGRSPEKRAALERMGARPADTNLFDPGAVERALTGVDVIINLATAVPPGFRSLWPPAWRPMDRVRREVSANLVRGAERRGGVERFIQEAFAPIYRDGGDAWLDETSPIAAASYNRSVLDAEANAQRMITLGAEVVVLRFAYLYGDGDAMTLRFLQSIDRGWFPLPGGPEGYTSWVDQGDAARAVLAALDAPGGVYNIVEDEPMQRGALAEGLARVMGKPAPRFLPRWVARHSGPVGETLARSLRISNRRFRSVTGWAPERRNAVEGMGAVAGRRGAVSSER